MVADVVENSLEKPAIALSAPMLARMNALKEWLYEHVYLRYPTVNPDTLKAQAVVEALFDVRRMAHALQAGAHLLGDGHEEIVEHLQQYGIRVGGNTRGPCRFGSGEN